MIQGYNKKFLKDLVELLRRHGPKPFLDLAEALTNPRWREELIRGLSELAKIAEEAQPHQESSIKQLARKQSEVERAHSLLESLRQSDNEKADLLSQLYDGLNSRILLPSKADVLEYCSFLHFPVSSQSQRNKLLLPVLRYLAGVPLQEVRFALERAVTASEDSGENYRRLANTIMKPTSTSDGGLTR